MKHTLILCAAVAVLLVGVLYSGSAVVKQAANLASPAVSEPAVAAETVLDAANRVAHAKNPEYDLSVLDDGKLRFLSLEALTPPELVFHGSKLVFRNESFANCTNLLTDQLTGEQAFIWDADTNTLMDADAVPIYHFERDTEESYDVAKYGDLLIINGTESCMNTRYVDQRALRAVVDLSTGKELPLPENAVSCTVSGDLLVFSCMDNSYINENGFLKFSSSEDSIVVQDRTGNTLYTLDGCLAEEDEEGFNCVLYSGFNRGHVPGWVPVCYTDAEGNRDERWLDPMTGEERSEAPQSVAEKLNWKAEEYRTTTGESGDVGVYEWSTGALRATIQLRNDQLVFLTLLENCEPIFYDRDTECVVDCDGEVLISDIIARNDSSLPGGVIFARNTFGAGWLKIHEDGSVTWVYFENFHDPW